MQKVPALPSALLFLSLVLPLRAEVREFHDIKGRPLKAELIKARGPAVVIRNEDGKEVSVPLKSFSRDDVTYICRWMAAEPTALDYRFDLRETERAGEKDKGPNVGKPAGSGYGTADESVRGYEISVSNRCQNPVEGIRVCYRVFLLDCVEMSGDYASVMNKRKLVFKSDNLELPTLTYNGSFKFNTRVHLLQKMRAANNYSGVSERDRLRGVWVRFYRHGVQVSEWKSGTVPRCEWPDNEDEKKALGEDKKKQKPLLAALTAPLIEPVKPATPVKPAPEVKPAPKPKPSEKDDAPEELKIFDLGDALDEPKPAFPPPLKK